MALQISSALLPSTAADTSSEVQVSGMVEVSMQHSILFGLHVLRMDRVCKHATV